MDEASEGLVEVAPGAGELGVGRLGGMWVEVVQAWLEDAGVGLGEEEGDAAFLRVRT